MRWLPAAVWMAGQGVLLVLLTVWLIVDQLTGRTSDTDGRGVGVIVVALCCAVGAGALAWFLWQHKSLAKTPTLLWNGILLLVGLSLSTAGAPVLGIGIMIVAVIGFLVGLRVPRMELDDDA